MRILAVDYGEKRVGLAISDETKKIAFARPHVEYANKEEITKIIKDNEVEKIILGLPKNLAGEETAAAKAARAFGDWLAAETGIAIQYVDERYSTKEILRTEIDKTLVDSLVAQKMLERYLDSRLRGNDK